MQATLIHHSLLWLTGSMFSEDWSVRLLIEIEGTNVHLMHMILTQNRALSTLFKYP